MSGSNLGDPREEHRPQKLRALGRGGACRWLAMVLIAPTVLWAGLAHADPGWLDEVKLGVLATISIF